MLRVAGIRLTWRLFRIRRRENLTWWLAKRVPHEVASRVFCLVVGHATTGCYGSTIVPELSAMEALRRWDTSNTELAAGGIIPAATAPSADCPGFLAHDGCRP